MLNYKALTQQREDNFRKMSSQFYAIVLEKDEIVPAYEVINTLQGSRRDIPLKIDVLDYPYDYIHENPFPVLAEIADEVDKQFRLTFDKICDFLG
jgi:hypothetical protein